MRVIQASLKGAMTFNIMTLSIMTLSITTLSITTLNITTLNITTLSIMTLSITTLSITTLSINGLFAKHSINYTLHNKTHPLFIVMLNVVMRSVVKLSLGFLG